MSLAQWGPEMTERVRAHYSESTVRRRSAGLSLIEIMIALGIVSVALCGIISAVLHSQTMQDLNRQLDLARNAAMAKMDEVRARDFDTVVATYGGAANANNRFGVTGLPPLAAVAANQIGVVTLDTSNSSLIEVRVRVEWRSQKGVRNYQTSAVITR